MDLRGLDLNLLVSLDALLAERNVTRAATRLHLTQPAVSSQLARLRMLFDDALLVPAANGRGMVPTPRALALAEPLHATLQSLAAIIRHPPTFDPRRDSRRFTIAASDNATAVFGVPLMARLPHLAGDGVRIAFVHLGAAQIATRLEQGQVDLMIGSERAVPPAMKARTVLEERFVMAQRKGHPRGTAALDLDSYCALGHILVSTSGGSFHGFMDEHLEALGRQRTVMLSVQDFTLVPELLRHTDYVATLPSRLARHYADRLDIFELPFAARGFTLHAAWHPRLQNDPAHAWLRGVLASLLDGAPDDSPS